MAVSVQCPTCSKELHAPDELVGKLASCPHCRTNFPLTMDAIRTTSGKATAEPPQTAATASLGAAPAAPSTPAATTSPAATSATATVPLAKPLKRNTAPSLLQPAADPPAPPAPSETPPAGGPPLAASAPAPSVSAAPPSATNLYPPGQAPAQPPLSSTSAAPASEPSPAATKSQHSAALTPPPSKPAKQTARPRRMGGRSAAKPSRAAQPARFIPADASATRVELGRDGQLPVLRLEEAANAKADQQSSKTSNPWLLVAALVFSFGMSAVMLFIDLEGAPAEKTTKRSARQEIETYYSRPDAQQQLYRKLLREALQAYNKGDYVTERRRYKQVLDLLHAENKDPYSGLTGQVSAGQPPHDRHLEELLSTLVDD